MQKGLRSAGGPKLLKWGLPGRGVKSAKVRPTPCVYYGALPPGGCFPAKEEDYLMCATLYGFIRFTLKSSSSRPDNWSAPRERACQTTAIGNTWDTATLGRHVHFHSYPGRLTRARIHRVNTRVSVRPRAARTKVASKHACASVPRENVCTGRGGVTDCGVS